MGYVLLDDQGNGTQLVFENPERLITAHTRQDLPDAFAAIEDAQADGKWLAGWMGYELGHALEPHFQAPETNGPLLQLGVFDAPSEHPPADWLYTRDIPDLAFEPSWSETDYLSRFSKVQQYLRSGDCYQVNLTFPMYAQSEASPTQIYAAFRRRQPGRYGAIVSLGGADIVSFSPELFFERRGENMRMRPMKGTRPRKGNAVEDAAILAEMQAEPKSRAENLMIVDLLRNDLSRLCETGSVKVPELFTLETYPTLHQMTSQVTGQLRKNMSWAETFKGLFPCGSVTGAPKIRAMEIIQSLESGPREAYCGSIGYIAPNGDASFSVAIRTVQIRGGKLRYDVGSGVVLDSDGPDEYRECLLKSQIFESEQESVFETFRRTPNGEIPHKALHARRLQGTDCASKIEIETELNKISLFCPNEDLRIRLDVKDRRFSTTTETYRPLDLPLKLALSRYPLTKTIQATSIKTTRRDFYDGERTRLQNLLGADEVIFLNNENEVCEGTFTSIFIKVDGRLLTPKLSCGLLPGVLRQSYIETGEAEEVVLHLQDLRDADQVFVGNSLRGLLTAKFIDFSFH